ncbi:MAG: twin-arginine translocase TatA/TatE family subunit [Planctomycetaceae bacterium]
MSLAFLTPGPVQLMILALVVLLLFGSRLPQTMRSLGKSVNEFKKGIREGEEDAEEEARERQKEKEEV